MNILQNRFAVQHLSLLTPHAVLKCQLASANHFFHMAKTRDYSKYPTSRGRPSPKPSYKEKRGYINYTDYRVWHIQPDVCPPSQQILHCSKLDTGGVVNG